MWGMCKMVATLLTLELFLSGTQFTYLWGQTGRLQIMCFDPADRKNCLGYNVTGFLTELKPTVAITVQDHSETL